MRYGGDEFLLVLAGADLALGRARAGAPQGDGRCVPVGARSAGLKVTLSIGIATRPRGGAIAATIAAADEALYDAKAAGRNRIATKG